MKPPEFNRVQLRHAQLPGLEPEQAHRIADVPDMATERLCRGCQFFYHRGVLLSHGVHLRNGLIYLPNATDTSDWPDGNLYS
jgi:hypothetical protein